MSSTAIAIFLGWLVSLAIFFGFIVLLRYLHHRERMALITQGINPASPRGRQRAGRSQRSQRMLRAGLIIAMVGLSLTIGLYPVGFILPAAVAAAPFHLGPWLLPGLIPLGVGGALIVSYYLEQNTAQSPAAGENVTPLKDHIEKKRQGQQE